MIVISNNLYSRLSSLEIEHILLHEQSHHKHNDDQVSLLLRTVLALSWFCPFTYWMFRRWVLSIELRSDQSLLANQSQPFRKAYANTLVKVLKLTKNQMQPYPTTGFSQSKLLDEKKRIKSILKGEASTFNGFFSKLIIISGASLVALSLATVTAGTNYAKVVNIGDLVNKDLKLILSGRLTASFGPTKNPFQDNKLRDHKGIDVAAAKGTPIYAPDDGIVINATDIFNNKPNYGKVVLIETSNDTKTLFAHLDSYSVKVGQRFVAGDLLGTVGETGLTTGPHVHLETYVKDQRVNPLDVWQLAK